MQRIAKAVSSSGLCSRRNAEKLIAAGKVKVNGELIPTPAFLVDDQHIIEVSGKRINLPQQPRMWIYYKPVGLITTHNDPEGRQTVFDNLPGLPRVISIGRLDINSEGLLLLTNNGELARKFELPSNRFERIYKVRARGNIIASMLKTTKQDIKIDHIIYHIDSIKLLKSNKSNSWYEVILHEGKNREIRKIFKYFGLEVNRLIRIKYGSYLLGDLKPSEYREVDLLVSK